jgi:hypothetical protein
MTVRKITRRRYAAVAALAGCLLAAGCAQARPGAGPASPASTPAPTATLAVGVPHRVPGGATYLGTITGTGALIGIAVQGTRARAYLCDGTPGRAVTLADWFSGPVRGGTLDAVSSQHRARLSARLGALVATGTITLADGRAYGFSAPLAAPGGPAGLFESTGLLGGLSYHAGRIVLPGGEQRGAAAYPVGPVRGRAVSYYPLAPV